MEAPLVDVDEAADEVAEPWKPAPEVPAVFEEPAEVAEAEVVLGLVRVAELIVVFLGKAVPVPALVPGATGTVVEAVPLAEMVLLE
jgi:hypothetical protein